MATLNINKKIFKPEERSHREEYLSSHLSLSKWKLEPPFTNVKDMMKSKLCEYYLSREFT